MLGFVRGAEYRSLVTQSLANAVLGSGEVVYYQLSTDVPGGVRQVNDKMRAADSDFYAKGDTRLETAIDSAKAGRLTVVITDLFQTNADMNAVSERLARRVLREGYAVGVFAVRLPFQGRIYDLGIDGRSFTFDGERPLYGLILGESGAVARYFEGLRTYVEASKYQFLIFTARVGYESAVFEKTLRAENLNEFSAPSNPGVRSGQRQRVQIRDNNSPARFQAVLRTDVIEEAAPLIEPKALEVKVVRLAKQEESSSTFRDSFSGAESAREALRGSVEPDGNQMILDLEIDPTKIQRGAYSYGLDLSVHRFVLPPWVDEWNLRPEEYENPDGSKTANLKPFLLSLGSALVRAEKPSIGTLQIFIEKEK